MTLPDGWVTAVDEVPARAYHIELATTRHVVRPSEATGAERELVCRMLERGITDRLAALREDFWRGEFWTLFFELRAENELITSDIVRAFRGFRFGVTLVDGLPYVAVDVRTRYLGRTSLAHATDAERRTLLRAHLGSHLRGDDRAVFVRDNGTRKIPCRYAGETGQSIADHTFEIDGRRQSVLDYYRGRYPHVQLVGADRAVYVQDRNGGLTFAVPESRLYPVFTTENEAIRRCSVAPQLAPSERLRLIESFLPFLKDIPYGARRLTPQAQYRRTRSTVFVPPALEFGDNVVVRPFGGSTPARNAPRFERGVLEFGKDKLDAIASRRPFHNEPLPDVVLFAPERFARDEREQLVALLSAEVERMTGQRLRIARQVLYRTGSGEREGSSLLREAEQLGRTPGTTLALVILAHGQSPAVHGALKETLGPVHSQCVTEGNARDLATGRQPSRIAGLLRNLALAVITEAGSSPWVLADRLHHAVHVGIDLLHGQVGYHAFAGRGGRHVSAEFGTALHQGRMREQIKRPELRRRLEHLLRRVAGSGDAVDSLVIHRDGRWWPAERDGLRDAIRTLTDEGVLSTLFRCAVAEIRKNHLPVRLFTERTHGSVRRLANPVPGSYLLLDGERAVLATTGRPDAWDGRRGGRTAGTLLIELVDVIGDISLIEVVEDAYRLTHLNWSAPDIEIALPVTIRWTDRALRERLRGEDRGASPDARDAQAATSPGTTTRTEGVA
ncbi:MAG: hypothetical protein M3081_15275 [Gemmatimonadota bacterium]|nr:hypothetical protein [Gemmatimonadota bacterium]